MKRALLSLLVLLALVGARRRSYNPQQTVPLNPTRSFAVTDKAILDGFSFERFLNALVERSGARTTALQFYQQWFDTQNPRPGLVSPNAPHCDDFITDGKASFNGFPRRCPTPEGKLALTNPFPAPEYIPIALMNRFDQAPADGANCGEYRAIFARVGQAKDTLHIIFEAVLPNPNPQAGLAGCKPVAQFWADLSGVSSMAERRARLERFFFTGIDGFEPVVDPTHYAGAGSGRVRTAQFTFGQAENSTRFYQFRISNDMLMLPDTLENMPHGRLFDGKDTSELATQFRDEFVTQVAKLAIRDVNLFFMQLSPKYLMHESDPGGLAFIYDGPFASSQNTAAGKDFSDRIQAELTRVGSALTPLQVINRAESQNCAGCHVISGPVGEGVILPAAMGIEHVTERESMLRDGEGGPKTRFGISPAVETVFVPHRMAILRDFLATGKAPEHSK